MVPALHLVEPLTDSVVVAIEGVQGADGRFVVDATSANRSWQFVTRDQWRAAICQRAHDTQRYVRIRYRRRARAFFGLWKPDILTVELV